MHPECEWGPFLSGVEGRSYSGHAGMLEFFDDFIGTFSPRYEIDEMRQVGPDAVVALGAMHLRGRESGAELTQELGALFEFEDELIRRGTASDHATTLAAVEAVLEGGTLPRRDDLQKILLIGSGPIVIGQAAEFDYSGVQACKVLREEGYEVVLVNSNPATIMTDPEFADRTYVEPLTLPSVRAIIDASARTHCCPRSAARRR